LVWAVTTEILLEYEEVAAREMGSTAAGQLILEGKMKNGKSACFTTDYTDFDGFHGEISLFSNELTAHPAG
jgi:hypothetical protein